MNVIVVSKEAASVYVPVNPTMAMRIFPSGGRLDFPDLQGNFTSIAEYTFDDLDPFEHEDMDAKLAEWGGQGKKLLDEDLAQRILADYVKGMRDAVDLLVSPDNGCGSAVGMAIHELFGHGAYLRRDCYNQFVYKRLVFEGKSMFQ